MSSGEVAVEAGVSVDTLRHYERRGLLARPPRARNGYRADPPEALARVMLIQRALCVGFSLDELARILRARERGMAPCVEVRALAARKLDEVERHIESLLAFRDTLRGTLEDWDSRLAKAAFRRACKALGIPRRSRERAGEGPRPLERSQIRPASKQEGESMIASRIPAAVWSFVALASIPVSAQQGQSSCDAHSAHSKTASDSTAAGANHPAKLNERGDAVMGFDHETTTHHFRLAPDGGAIEVTANDQAEVESRTAIRSHLAHIAKMFAAGNYQAPMLVHDQIPPGVPVMTARKAKLRWAYEDLPAGARLSVTTKDPEALSAVHEFLRFQIEDHQTGDPKEMPGSAGSPPRDSKRACVLSFLASTAAPSSKG